MRVSVSVSFVARRGVEHPHRFVEDEERRETNENGAAAGDSASARRLKYFGV